MVKKVIAQNENFTGKGASVSDPDDDDRYGIIVRFANDTEFWVDWDDNPVDRDEYCLAYDRNVIEVELCKF
jgi:hypothetical protein